MRVCSDCKAHVAKGTTVDGRCPTCGGLLIEAPEPESLLGRELDRRFSIQERIGAGGMGTVYRATQLAVNRSVAIKVLSPFYATRPRSVRRFVKEARAASRLNHPNIVTLYDFGQAAEGYLYIVMELLHGESLTDLLRHGPVSLRRAVMILEQVCAALTEAHSKGVVHCDLKPDNVFIVRRHDQEDAVKVLDFGIAKIVSADGGSSSGAASREVCGTPDYMSPERILGRPVGPETDLYSLGIILHQVLTGTRPYAATNPMQVCLRHLNDPIPVLPPTLAADGSPSGPVQELLVRLLHKEPSSRLRSADEARSALRALIERPSPVVAPPLEPEPEPEASAPVSEEGGAADMPTQARCERCGGFNAGHWRFCGTCGAPMDELLPCSACSTPLPPGAQFCIRCGLRLSRDDAPRGAPPGPLLGGEPEARRMVSTVHALATIEPREGPALDLEDRIELLRPLVAQWSDAVRRAGGTVHAESGEGLCAIFGVPATGQADALSAVRCALALRDGAADFEPGAGRLLFRCGVSTGAALVRRRTVEGSWSVKGDVVVQAALLAGDAPVGGVVCSDASYQEVRDAVTAVSTVSANGRGDARWLLREMRARHTGGRPKGVDGVTLPLIGRDTELATLQGRMLATVHNRTPHLVTVVGAPGVGKTRLVHELLEWVQTTLPESLVLRGRALRQAEQPPYQLFRDVMAGAAMAVPEHRHDAEREAIASWLAANTVRSVAAPLMTLLGLEPSPGGDPFQIQQRGFVAAGQLVQSITRGGPLVLALDHLHSADGGSLDLVSTLVDRLVDTPLLVVCCTSPRLYETRPLWDSGRGTHTRLDLRPMAPASMVRFVEALLQRAEPLPAEVRELVVQRSEGNPYFAEEVVRLLLQRGVIEPQPDGAWRVKTARLDGLAMPRSIEGLLQARVDVLGDEERAVLSAAAIVGNVFWRGAVDTLVGGMLARPLDDVLIALRRAGLIRKRRGSELHGEQELRFESGLLREVVHGGLLKKARRSGHETIARWLEARVPKGSGDLAGALATHHEEGGDLASAFRWYRAAADRAEAVFATADAQRCLARAIALAPEGGLESPAELATLHERLGDVQLHGGRHAEARASFLEALSVVGSDGGVLSRAELLRKVGKTWYLAQDLARATETLDDALSAAGEGPSAVKMATLAEIGWVSYLRGRHDEAERSLEQGIALADALPADEPSGPVSRDRALANLYATLGAVALCRGRREKAVDLYEEARELFWAAGLKTNAAGMDMNVGVAQLAMGHPERALTPLRQALDVFEALGHRYGVSAAHNNLGRAHTRLGKVGEAEAHLILGRNVGEEVGAAVRVAEACCWLAELALQQMQVDRALMEARRAITEADRSQVVEVRGAARRIHGLVLGAMGRAEEAHQSFREAVDALEAQGPVEELALTTRAWGGYCLDHAGEGDRRVELLRRGAALLRQAAAIYQTLGLAPEADEAVACLRRTVPLA